MVDEQRGGGVGYIWDIFNFKANCVYLCYGLYLFLKLVKMFLYHFEYIWLWYAPVILQACVRNLFLKVIDYHFVFSWISNIIIFCRPKFMCPHHLVNHGKWAAPKTSCSKKNKRKKHGNLYLPSDQVWNKKKLNQHAVVLW